MTRGGARKDRDGPKRRCIVLGDSGATETLIRFVVSPAGVVTPDLAEKLPGRGIWVSADRAALERAVTRNLFARSARTSAKAAPDLQDLVEKLLADRTIQAIALCRKAGLAVCGYERCREAAPRSVALAQASDGAIGGKSKLRGVFRGLEIDFTEITCLSGAELGLAFGRTSVIHSCLAVGGATKRALREAQRLQGIRKSDAPGSDREASDPDRF